MLNLTGATYTSNGIVNLWFPCVKGCYLNIKGIFMRKIRTNSRKKIISFLTLIVVFILGITACGNTKDTETLISEAKQYQQSGDDNAAIIQLKNALQQEPNNREARYLIGVSYNETGDMLSAEKEFNRAIDLGMDSNKVIPILGESLLKIGEFQQLLDKTKDFPNINNSIEILLLRGKAQLALGMNEEAKGLFEQVLGLEPDSPEALIGLARYSIIKGDIESSMRFAAQAVRKNATNTDALLFLGDLFRAQNKTDQALSAFDQVIKIDPDNTTAYINRATLKINTGEFEEARLSVESAKAISPDNLIVIYTQALLDFSQDNHSEALNSIQQVLSLAPNHMPSVLLAGSIQNALGSFSQAEQHLEQYIKVNPNNLYARKLIATILLKNQQAHLALDYIAPALSTVDQDPQLYALAGEAYIQMGDLDKANEYFSKASVLAPNSAELHTAVAISNIAQGHNEHAVAELKAAIDLDGDANRAGVLLVMTHIRLGEFDKALNEAEALEMEYPNNPLFQNLKGGVYMSKGDFNSARASFNKALSTQADYYPAITNLARLDIQENNPEAAENRFKAILVKDDKNVQAMYALANLALTQQDVESATKWFELASNKHPDEVQPAIQLAAFYLQSGEKDKPLLIAQKLLGAHPDDLRVLAILGQSQLANDQKSAALDNFEKIAARSPDSAEAQLRVAAVHASMENHSAASSSLERALNIDPGFLGAKIAQVQLAVQSKNENAAIEYIKGIQKQHDELPIGYVLEGDLLLSQDKHELASKAYEQAVSITQNSTIMIKLHDSLNRSGKGNEADTKLNKWLADNPTDAETRLYLAGSYLDRKQNDAAIKEYETIIQQFPEHALTLNNLAWLYQQKKDPRAVEYAERAHQQLPEAPAILDTLGWILVENGDVSRGKDFLQKAATLAPNSGEIQYHFATALAKSGDETKAREILEKVLASDETFSQIEEARRLLTQLK